LHVNKRHHKSGKGGNCLIMHIILDRLRQTEIGFHHGNKCSIGYSVVTYQGFVRITAPHQLSLCGAVVSVIKVLRPVLFERQGCYTRGYYTRGHFESKYSGMTLSPSARGRSEITPSPSTRGSLHVSKCSGIIPSPGTQGRFTKSVRVNPERQKSKRRLKNVAGSRTP